MNYHNHMLSDLGRENTESRKSEGGEGGVWEKSLAKNNRSEVKPGRAGLVLGRVTTLKQKPLYRSYYFLHFKHIFF